jgi:pSer/pThr/pTyr-binding forkhead associated (FHA) protein
MITSASTHVVSISVDEVRPHAILFDMDSCKVHSLADDAITIGSSSRSTICLSAEDSSPQHCLIVRYADGYKLYDLNSATGCSVNGVRIRENCQIFDGDELKVGNRSFVFNLVQSDAGKSTGSQTSWVKAFGNYLRGMAKQH